MARGRIKFQIAAESNSFEMLRGLVLEASLISFQIRIGTMPVGNKLGLVTREIDDRDTTRQPGSRAVAGAQPSHSSSDFCRAPVRALDSMRKEARPGAVARAG